MSAMQDTSSDEKKQTATAKLNPLPQSLLSDEQDENNDFSPAPKKLREVSAAFLSNISNSIAPNTNPSPLSSPNRTFSFSCSINSEPTEIIQIRYSNCMFILITQSQLKIGTVIEASLDLEMELARSNDLNDNSYTIQTVLGQRPIHNSEVSNNNNSNFNDETPSLADLYQLTARQLIHSICKAGELTQLVLAIAFNNKAKPDLSTVRQIVTVIEENKLW